MTQPWRLIASPVSRLHDGREIRWKDGDGGGERSRNSEDNLRLREKGVTLCFSL